MNKEKKRIAKDYVRVVQIADAWNTYVNIEFQSFCIVEQTTKERAIYFGEMMASALHNLLKIEKRKELEKQLTKHTKD